MHLISQIFCAIGMINGLFLAAFFAFAEGEYRVRKYILSLLIGLTALRIGKYLVISFNMEAHAFYHIIWFGSLALMGILVYFLVRSFFDNKFEANIQHGIHLIPALIVIVTIALEPFKYIHTYVSYFIIPLLFLYLILSIHLLLKYGKGKENSFFTPFIGSIVVAAALLWLVHLVALFWRYNFFMAEALLFSSYVYIMTFWIVRNWKTVGALFNPVSLPQKLSQSEMQLHVEKIESYFNHAAPYLRNAITLPVMAKELKLSHHLLSRVINEHYQQNFSDLVNRYRIEHAKKLIRSEKYKNITLSGIAFDSGFSSISAFNAAFKKFSGQTPSNFKNSTQE